MLAHHNLQDLFDHVDMFPAQVAFDGTTTWFTEHSEQAYKYMMNVVDESRINHLFDVRVTKYLNYGFSIVLPELNMKKVNGKKKEFLLENCQFVVKEVVDKCIMSEKATVVQKPKGTGEMGDENGDDALYQGMSQAGTLTFGHVLDFIQQNKILYLVCSDKNPSISVNNEFLMVDFHEKKKVKLHFKNYQEFTTEVKYDLYGPLRFGGLKVDDSNNTSSFSQQQQKQQKQQHIPNQNNNPKQNNKNNNSPQQKGQNQYKKKPNNNNHQPANATHNVFSALSKK